jgi:hypothetical protein
MKRSKRLFQCLTILAMTKANRHIIDTVRQTSSIRFLRGGPSRFILFVLNRIQVEPEYDWTLI